LVSKYLVSPAVSGCPQHLHLWIRPPPHCPADQWPWVAVNHPVETFCAFWVTIACPPPTPPAW